MQLGAAWHSACGTPQEREGRRAVNSNTSKGPTDANASNESYRIADVPRPPRKSGGRHKDGSGNAQQDRRLSSGASLTMSCATCSSAASTPTSSCPCACCAASTRSWSPRSRLCLTRTPCWTRRGSLNSAPRCAMPAARLSTTLPSSRYGDLKSALESATALSGFRGLPERLLLKRAGYPRQLQIQKPAHDPLKG